MNAFRIALLVGVTVVGSCGVANAQQQVMKVGYPPFNPPLSFLPNAKPDTYKTLDPNGTLAEGAGVELIKTIAKDAGFEIQLVAMVAPDFPAALNAKNIDVYLGGGQSTDLPLEMALPIYSNSEGLLVLKADANKYKSWDDLKGEVVAAQAGTPSADAAQKSGLFKEVKTAPSGPEVNQLIRSGAAKAAIVSSLIASTYNQKQGAYEPDLQLVATYQPRFPVPGGIWTRKGDPLLTKINASLLKLKGDGTITTIFSKYGIADTLAK